MVGAAGQWFWPHGTNATPAARKQASRRARAHCTLRAAGLQVAVMPVRVVWGDNQIGILFGLEMVLSLLLLADVVLSFHTGGYWASRVGVQVGRRQSGGWRIGVHLYTCAVHCAALFAAPASL